MRDGANVLVQSRAWNDAQAWEVSERADGTLRILSKLAGKSLDVNGGSLASGTNVQMWTDNGTRAQAWQAADTGETATIDGTAYALYTVALDADDTLVLDVSGGSAASGTNVQIYTANQSNAQKWAFVPIPTLFSGGLYEMRSALDTSRCVDIAAGSTANGANAQLYAANGTNAQKFVFVDEGDGWSIRNVQSGKYLDVAGGSLSNGANVQSYEDNDTRAQRWLVTAEGTTTVDGAVCQVISAGAANGDDFVLDVSGASTANHANIQIYEDNGTLAQRFVLVPTEALDAYMPVPYNLGFAPTLTGAVATEHGILGDSQGTASATYYPAWDCADAWATSGANSYQWRYRTREMDSSAATWGEWGDWTAWATAAVTKGGTHAAVTEGVSVSFDIADAKAVQVQYECRSCGADGLELLHGGAASCTGTFAYRQNVTLSGCTWTPDGLTIGFSDDYAQYGSTTLYVSAVKWDGTNWLAVSEASYKLLEDDSSFTISQDDLRSIPSDGDAVTLVFGYGSDLVARWSNVAQTAALEADVNAGTAPSYTFADAEGATLALDVADETARAWVVWEDGMLELDPLDAESGHAAFQVVFPMGCDYSVVIAGVDASGDTSFVTSVTRHETGACHAWTLADGTAVSLAYREGGILESSAQTSAMYESYAFNSREWESYRFSDTRKRTFDAEGACVPSLGTSTFAQVESLVGQHALYRSPTGDMCDVAVLSVSRSANVHWSDVKVSMAREAV